MISLLCVYQLIRRRGIRVEGPKKMNFPSKDQPRERLILHGPESLRSDELLAIILQVGHRDCSVFDLAKQILEAVGGIQGLIDVRLEELTKLHGVGRNKALQICAAVELGRRVIAPPSEVYPIIRSAEDAANLVMEELRYLKREHFVTLYLDTKHRLMAKEVSSIGSLDASIVHPREIFMPAVRRSASAILCMHNHPSGDPTPSKEDICVTQRLDEVGRILGIELLDHIIIGDGRFCSLKAKHLI